MGGRYMAQLLEENETLTELNLTANEICNTGAKALFIALETNCHLKKLVRHLYLYIFY